MQQPVLLSQSGLPVGPRWLEIGTPDSPARHWPAGDPNADHVTWALSGGMITAGTAVACRIMTILALRSAADVELCCYDSLVPAFVTPVRRVALRF